MCEQKSQRKEVTLDHDDGAEGSRDWVSVLQIHWRRCCLVAGGQDEASGETLALAHPPATKAALCLSPSPPTPPPNTANSMLISLGRLLKGRTLTFCSSKLTLQLKDKQARPDIYSLPLAKG